MHGVHQYSLAILLQHEARCQLRQQSNVKIGQHTLSIEELSGLIQLMKDINHHDGDTKDLAYTAVQMTPDGYRILIRGNVMWEGKIDIRGIAQPSLY